VLPDVYTCPACGARSRHPEDQRAGYCGRCHQWTRDPRGPYIYGVGWHPDAVLTAAVVAVPVGWHCRVCTDPIAIGDAGYLRPTGPGGIPEAVHAGCDLLPAGAHAGTGRAAGDALWRRSDRLPIP
jgi:rubredoxin